MIARACYCSRVRPIVAALAGVAAVALAVGCSGPHRTLTIAPTLPPCVRAAVNSVRVEAQGDFPPEASLTAAASPSAPAQLDLPRATRVVSVEGFGPTGLAAFGRTAPLNLDDVKGATLGIAYGPPDGLCATHAMQFPRSGHRAIALGSGVVLITGGDQHVELYDPATASFRATGVLLRSDQVNGHAAAPLADGGALVSGGDGGGAPTLAATRFDGAGRTVGQPRLLLQARTRHSATLLTDGRVLVAGGCGDGGGALATSELYDPAADAFAPGPPLLRARCGHDAVLRGDGTVLLVGGVDGSGATPPAEIVDPNESRGQDAGVVGGRAAALATGSVLVVGGAQPQLWLSPGEPPLPLSTLPTAPGAATLTALDDGGVLVAGDGLFVFDGRAAVRPLAATYAARGHAAARLADGTVLLSGGDDGGGAPSASAALYFRSPLSAWSSLPPLTLDGSSDPYLPRRPDRAVAAAGQLVVTAPSPSTSGAPAELALVAGMRVADFAFDLLAGRRGGGGAAAVIVGWQSEASYRFVVIAPGRAAELWAVSSLRAGQPVAAPVAGCRGVTLDDTALPAGDAATLHVEWRGGQLAVAAAGRAVLSCRPLSPLPRGAVGVGALAGTVAFGNLAVVR